MRDPAAPRIGVVFPGDASNPRQWSGTPYGVLTGLRAAGADAVPVNAALPGPAERAVGALIGLRYLPSAEGSDLTQRARRAYSTALVTPAMGRVRTARLAATLRDGSFDGLVQIGTGFQVPSSIPVATYEDMTIKQALDYPYAHWSTLGESAIGRRIALQRRCYAAASAVCMTNSWAASSATADYGVSPSRVHVVGVGTHEEPRSVPRDWSSPRFLFIGVEFERKNGPRVLRAFARLRETHPDAQLDVVGGHPPIDQPGVTGHGFVRRDDAAGRAKLRELFDRATCFVMPSLFEPSAVVYTEAAAAGLPSIGTRIGGSADIVGNGGVSIDPYDDESVYRAMLEYADPQRAAEVGARAGERSALFTWQAVAERLLRALDPDLLGRPLQPFL
jgi:hypothetical protein